MNSAEQVLAIGDIGTQLASKLPWSTLDALRTVNHATIALATAEQAHRLHLQCSEFFPAQSYDSFVTNIETWEAGIVGSVPLASLLPSEELPSTLKHIAKLRGWNNTGFVGVRDLNVLVPQVAWTAALQWFKSNNFSTPASSTVAAAYVDHVTEHVSMMPPGVEMVSIAELVEGVSLGELEEMVRLPKRFVTLSCVKTSILAATLAAPFACQTVLYTGACLIDLFPETRHAYHTYYNGGSLQTIDKPSHYWHSCASQDFSIIPCGNSCPTLSIDNNGLRKYSFIRLKAHPQNDALLNQLLNHTSSVTRYKPICLNRLCVNHEPLHRFKVGHAIYIA